MGQFLKDTICQHSGGSAVKESTCNAGRPGFNPWVGKIPWRREKATHLQYSDLENSMDCTVHGVAESNTTEQLSKQSKSITKRSNLNRPTSDKETESVISKLLKQKTPGPNGFTGEFH